ncbi:methyltransferase domain-containing protein [Allorhizobium sp. BGMRC 0089]|uniref:class I SAM-dependent methyltransferase n=1 Tax=Allorhizobium sonneratiae TaxID=2934936 RepID=UPI0020338EB7|nr:methyltransferase domain-containing protein [Allorhizobium sonneratiae]MCM2291281.1 methyltransferase domain-containing protein [Allorhizobium sonneratiae]
MIPQLFAPVRALFDRTVPGTTAYDLSPSLVTPTKTNPRNQRLRYLRQHITRETKVLEVGPLAAPVVPKREGYNVFIADHLDRQGLIDYYAYSDLKPEKFEEVDFIWSSGDLADAVSQDHHGTFDVIILSHVLEHLPNPIGFLQSCATLLKTGGYLTLALPDKRYCFDMFRPLTTTGQWLTAYEQSSAFHSKVAYFDYATMVVASKYKIGWNKLNHRPQDLTFIHMALKDAYKKLFVDDNRVQNAYEDCHASVFTPASFALVAQECHALGVSPLALDYVSTTHKAEFFAHLRLIDREPINHHDRIQLMAFAAQEQAIGYRSVKIAKLPVWTRMIRALKAMKKA